MAFINVKFTRKENYEEFNCAPGTVMKVPFEDYVTAVVASEIGNSDVEACKAQAIAARTFAVNKGVLEGKEITDSSAKDQAFRISRLDDYLYPNAMRAAELTEGQILTYNGKPIAAVYSSCNGGHTVSAKERWGSERKYLPAQVDPWDNSTKRTGHGVGMSQRGAKAMAKAGKNYKEILSFYYPGTKLETLPDTTHTTNTTKGGERIVTAQKFIDKVWIPLNEGWGYIYGTWGSLWTAEKQAKATRDMTVKYGSKWIGKMVTDCSGLLRWALYQLGESIVHHARYQYTDYCRNKGKLINGLREDGSSILPGTAVFLQGNQDKIHHVGVYVGDNTCIEAKGTIYGVVTSELSHWDHWGELIMVDYSGDTPVTPSEDVLFRAKAVNPNTWLNVRSGPGKHYPVQFQLQRGTVVDVLAHDDGWMQIRSGGRIGWASADYLTPLIQEEPEAVDEMNETLDDVHESVDETEARSPIITDLETVLTGLSDLENLVADILRRL